MFHTFQHMGTKYSRDSSVDLRDGRPQIFVTVEMVLSPGLSYRLGASAAGEFIFCLVRLPEATAQAMLGVCFPWCFFFCKGYNIP